ncbi:MAG: hemolysin family protein [Syntrophales bacterium]
MPDNLISILLILVFLGLEGLFSGGEIALVASDMNKITQKANTGSKSAALLLRLLKKPEWFFATALTGTDMCIITVSVLAASLSISIFGPVQGEFFSALVMIPVILVFGEIIPKSLFQQNAESVAMRISWFIWVSSRLFYPIVFVVAGISRWMVALISGSGESVHSTYITKDGLKFLLRERSGIVSDVRVSEKEMVRRIFDFSETTVDKIMVPLSNVTALEKDTTLREASVALKGKWFSRIPVYKEKIFNVIGILHGFDLLRFLPDAADRPVGDFIRTDVLYVPEMKRANELLIEMQRKGQQMAVIVDEYGGAVGIVTVEDMLEEIVGEIEDEYDKGERAYKKIGRGKFLFDARMSIEHVRELIHVEIPAGAYETLGGFMLDKLGKIPRRGETLRYGDVLFLIHSADTKSIKEILVELPYDVEIV